MWSGSQYKTTYSRSPVQVHSISLWVAIPWWTRTRLTSAGSSHASSQTALPPCWAPLPWSQTLCACPPLGNSVCSGCVQRVFFYVTLLGGGHCHWRWKPISLFLPFFSVSFATTVHPLSSALPLLLSSCFFLSFSEPLLFNLTPSPPILPLSLLTGNFWRSFSILSWSQWMRKNPLPFTLSFSPSALG